jgi:cation:H+ antiporter
MMTGRSAARYDRDRSAGKPGRHIFSLVGGGVGVEGSGMSTSTAVFAFVAGALVSLGTSWVLVTRIERIGGRLGASEAMLGLLAAVAADTPEISSAVSALAHDQQSVAAGVVLGSNVFNLAALLGLGAVVAGGIALHRRVVALEGGIGLWVAAVALLTVLHVTTPVVGLLLVFTILIPYVVLAGLSSASRRARLGPSRIEQWLGVAIYEEEVELSEAIHPRRGRSADFVVGLVALVVVVTASIVMERAASTIGDRFSIPDIVVGTIVLAAVTSLPNAVAAVYLARRGRGAASLSTALNSNAINVTAGLLIPAAVLTIGPVTADVSLVTAWYLGLTGLVVGFAYLHRGLRRAVGALIVAAYVAFVATVIATASRSSAASLSTYLLPVVAILAGSAALLVWPQATNGAAGLDPRLAPRTVTSCVRPDGSAHGRSRDATPRSMVPGWSVTRLWLLAMILSCAVAACDALLGRKAILMGLLIVGPCCALLTGRWAISLATGVWVFCLAILLSIPDGVWGTREQEALLAAIAVVSLVATLATALIEHQRTQFPQQD